MFDYVYVVFLFVYFKQKTAYEMRISDWSSDVCSSDLMFMPAAKLGLHYYPHGLRRWVTRLGLGPAKKLFLTSSTIGYEEMLRIGYLDEVHDRSEEHTSELQSLMRISYAVFCLKKKKR